MPTLTACLLVGAGGFLGAVARYLVAAGMASVWRAPFPAGTFLINVTGSFLIGLAGAVVARRLPVGPEAWRLAFVVGFLGAYTTFSTFSSETDWLMRDGRAGLAVAYVAASVVAGLAAVRGGAVLARVIW